LRVSDGVFKTIKEAVDEAIKNGWTVKNATKYKNIDRYRP